LKILHKASFNEAIELKNPKSSTQVALAHGCHSLMSCHIHAKRTNGKEPLVEYCDFYKVFEDYATKNNG
jgi:hypothetical protein